MTPGVRYHVAFCHEHLGRLATALGEYFEAEKQARDVGAKDVLAAVGPRLEALMVSTPRVAILVVPNTSLARASIDGTLLDASSLGSARPIDPGVHHVEVAVPGAPPERIEVQLAEGDVSFIRVAVTPPPASAGAKAAPPANDTRARTPTDRPRTEAIALSATAAALVVAGVGAYLEAGSTLSNGVGECRLLPSCDGQRAAVRAWDWTALGAWTAAAGASALATFFWVRPRTEEATAAALRLELGPTGIRAAGSF
jgi:hypothetical protein